MKPSVAGRLLRSRLLGHLTEAIMELEVILNANPGQYIQFSLHVHSLHCKMSLEMERACDVEISELIV